ncbi:hypothetical protein HN51_037521 [Arachis hypogaea]|uniref:RING-type E3 ubiquitin transferase n=1 Tax=Arachis hypogaea TaxID=3818 RepID=A0A444ZVQ1_ARAHY|nr:putative U-box domain-containing protein 50 isoform X1 [Arachis ipaensis]XP_025638714.1 putative U-box domain-containing protein 50 isoform X1 [Arachis hypogaea]QHO03077.1 Putative U-box domain-containing protein [Arachis hypogaea]RYR18237.1 hypothetical protein Ahy_B03g062852 [Arachis hypogaea]
MNGRAEREKIYVALGNNVLEGIHTLAWTLSKWHSHPISIIILHVKYNNTCNHLSTLLGNFPEGIACDVKMERIRKGEEDKIDKMLSKYISFCDNVPAEILDIEQFDEPVQKRTIDLIYGLGITKLVMAFSFMKASLKQKDAMNAMLYVHKQKPGFCELFFVCEGIQVFLREKDNDETVMEDDNGVTVARMKDNNNKSIAKWCLERLIFSNSRSIDSDPTSSSSSSVFPLINQNLWEFYLREIENYYQELLSLNLEEENHNSDFPPSQYESLREELNEAYNRIQTKRKEAKQNIERHEKAEWAIWFCNRREEELENRIKEEVAAREELKKELERKKEEVDEISVEVEETKKMVIQVSETERQQRKVIEVKTQILGEIEELRKQRIMGRSRRVVAEAVNNNGCCVFREYREEEIVVATHSFWDELRMKGSVGGWSNVYKGRINGYTVAIKMLNSLPAFSQLHYFLAKVKILGSIRHPHLVDMLGFCSEPKCIILEYMDSGSLGDILHCRVRKWSLWWHDRIRIAIEVCSGLGFLHESQPRPIIHCRIDPSNILLDHNLVAKITGFGLHGCGEECNVGSDVKAVGVLLMQLLTGKRNFLGMVREDILDGSGGKWPLDVAKEVEDLAKRSMSNEDMSIARVMEELNEIRRKHDSIAWTRID